MMIHDRISQDNTSCFWIAYGPALLHGQVAPGERIETGQEFLEVFTDAEERDARLSEIGFDLPAAIRAAREIPTNPRAILAAHRWERETAGISLPDGTPVRTDERTRLAITSGVAALKLEAPGTTVEWKFSHGAFLTVDLERLEAILFAVSRHVQTCFRAEKEVAALIDAGTLKDPPERAFDTAFARIAADMGEGT
ncbi:DUF4376 domain-containing protein [Thalassococcus sp. S3]|uniref:DUF4376 domain-containing protein n=1 Tax=Thalassococcus sp. S3 TaxID=2017482 RepID=UPI0010246A80|nr:DUF4376 domain-containing protein [Thalassococcus sp. S3]QBF32134.1 hypothetical protein CFI11_13025 [Thalassococcus sp. S3]